MQPLCFGHVWSTIVFHGSFAIWVVPELIGNVFQWSGRDARHRDRGSLVLLAFSFCGGLLLAFGLAYGVPDATLRWGWPVLFLVGVVCNLLGVALRWYAIRLL